MSAPVASHNSRRQRTKIGTNPTNTKPFDELTVVERLRVCQPYGIKRVRLLPLLGA
ncbi:hypothetical protein BN8_00416 [Fibrisoma limi BUZ 3]|uniref:Uncharacterized protein n=1 Tax=Fibrisoma limi BUZ 3 TaxID=1185876 RepID=I2GC65_9BACT|nr:hypothetical protein BN8_00416 [Fibrisoma limi BUZ 3]